MRLSLKIQLPIIALIMLIVGASVYFSYRQSSRALEAALVKTMRGEAEALVRSLGIMVSGVLEAAERIIELDDVVGFYKKNPESQEEKKLFSAKLKHIVSTYDDFDRVALISDKGIILASTAEESVGHDYSDRGYFQSAIQGKSVVSQPLLSRVTGKGVIIAAAPVKVDGRISGVVYCSIPLNRFFETSVRPITIGDSGYAFVLAQNGFIIMHKNDEYLFKDLPTTMHYKAMIAGEQESGVMEYVGIRGELVYNYFCKDAVSGLVVIMQAESSDVFSTLAQMRDTALFIGLASVLVGVVLLFFLIRPVLKALNSSIEFASRVAAGDLSGTLSISRKDELGKLADALRAIPAALKGIILEYRTLEKRSTHGELGVEADAGSFAGEFASLVEGTNAILRRFRRIVDSIPSPVIVLDQDLKVAFINEAARELAGDDFRGRTCEELMGNDDSASPASALRQAVAENRRVSAETRAHPRGRDMDVAYSVSPMPDNAGRTA
ncbi:MAG: PAS domain-containing protein, partial [Deltaproteobacteria bacterium]|nr:PAS domain-containing protein [Deltaproteobacteria bacterium]